MREVQRKVDAQAQALAQVLAQVLADLPVGSALLMFAAFFVGALGEELGWSGYVLGPLQRRWSAFQSSLILGAVAVAWHLVPLLALHRAPAWIAWWCLYAVAARILIVWLLVGVNYPGRPATTILAGGGGEIF